MSLDLYSLSILRITERERERERVVGNVKDYCQENSDTPLAA